METLGSGFGSSFCYFFGKTLFLSFSLTARVGFYWKNSASFYGFLLSSLIPSILFSTFDCDCVFFLKAAVLAGMGGLET